MVFLLWLLFAALEVISGSQVLIPPYINLALNRKIHATATCGDFNGESYREVYCQIAGSSQYTPLNAYAYNAVDTPSTMRELKLPKPSFIEGGQVCDYCEANTSYEHPAEFMVDGGAAWWQSPPLSRGKQYEQINITIDLGQEFHVAYVWIQMANSPRPGKWVLERSVDYGRTYTPWQYFAETAADCQEFGKETLAPILRDDSVICSTEFSSITPLENAEMMVRLLENRPGRGDFSHSEVLQNFAKATNVRLRLLRMKTLHGHLISLQKRKDPSVTRRHFYAIKEILMGGRCVCNGHAATCDVLDVKRPNMLLCRCEHNTCGDQCERCCPGFEQKKWQRARDDQEFKCEPCNCHGHSNDCVYDEELDRRHLSLDIHGKHEGGGRCVNCQDNTEGINCNKCVPGYYRPYGKTWNDPDVCQPCRCDSRIHDDICEEETGHCKCKAQFTGPNCDRCAYGYYSPPICKPCDCSPSGTSSSVCLPIGNQCPCKPNYAGKFCDKCALGFTNFTAGCLSCNCTGIGSLGKDCDLESGQCDCRTNFGGLICDKCADGYYDYPRCEYCNCDPSGTEEGLCDKKTGVCLCKPGFTGPRCDRCDHLFYGYPNCKACSCDPYGAESQECEWKTGDCSCRKNFIGRQCDRCKPGYYDYPNCKACHCHADGSEGLTCDGSGKCFCKPNFQGDRCDECRPNFYNFPLCEECRCNPNGVSKDFGGCDKVGPGKLCECKKNVEGRICDRCKPTFWGLSYQLEDGCSPCGCNLNGTLAGLDTCEPINGQCPCKEYAAGRDCSRCAEGYYNLQGHNMFGCQPCNCNKGGSVGIGCDMYTGQCSCRARVTGLKCDRAINDHYTPTLWHHKYEAENSRTPDGDETRYASDRQQFANFSSRGFAAFSGTQDEILIPLNIQKPTLYQILFLYVNPSPADAEVELTVVPSFPNSQIAEQSVSSVLAPSKKPSVVSVNKRQPFALSRDTWTLHIKIPKRVFLDYIALLPAEYYEANLLKEAPSEGCEIGKENDDCLQTSYPPLPSSTRVAVDEDRTFNQVDPEGKISLMDKMPPNLLPSKYGKVAHVQPSDQDTQIQIELQIPETDNYVLVLEYNNFQTSIVPLQVEVQTSGKSSSANAIIEHCPYEVFCRNLAVSNGTPASFLIEKGNIATVTITVPPQHEFGLAAINLIKTKDWDSRFLNQVPVCTRKNGQCVEQIYPPAANEVVKEVESGPNSDKAINADKLPFPIADSAVTQVLLLDEHETSFDVESSVPESGRYVFVVHYYNPENAFLKIPVYLNTDNFYDCILPVEYCPNRAGCRAVIQDIKRKGVIDFYITDKFDATFNHNNSQKGPVYINSLITVPIHSYTDSLLKLQPVDVSNRFIQECGKDEFINDPSTVTDYCRENVFALTTDFNTASFPCSCNATGSKSFSCEQYGGQCSCRSHIIGRQCDQCEPGYYDFPHCRKCSCLLGQTCDERTGQCRCPKHVEGKTCDKCVQYAFGYDPLIGCQLCQCHARGLDEDLGTPQCDPENGQCLCKLNVGGRQCNQCLPGYYGFPYCYPCACDKRGTTGQICDPQSSTCICKENVEGPSCDRCKLGKFYLEEANSLGCSDCFCFGATDRCISSNYPVDYVHFDREAWQITDPKGTLRHLDGQVHYFASPDEAPLVVYFKAPLDSEMDFTHAYGLKISFRISSQPKGENGRMSVAADLKLVGYNMTLEHWISEVPTNVKQAFSVHIRLIPENFVYESGVPVKRSDLMLVLFDLNEILIKASYYEKTDLATLTDFEMEIAKNTGMAPSRLTATSVEVCRCPAPYTGNSCQYCSDGFYRVKTGNYLGACIACDCNGHSGFCDKNTGICHECQHHTTGDHCEFCEEGYYGNATRGGPYACLPCACPSPYNNFATSCKVTQRGALELCSCKEGYTGERCDRCANGYFGEPRRPNGFCTKCSCSENNDLTAEGSCDPFTGRCDNCLYHTAGEHCEVCEDWFYGIAVDSRNCTDCQCDRCGSTQCDKATGKCVCKPNIEGEKCNQCVADAWGFHRCTGCDMCDCSLASRSTQCDKQTGQCNCMPGAAGARCETCAQGYWNYTASGCTKCDCEADLSLGTVCDIATGQCHCQQGATGPRCDQCLARYLRIPDFGCRICDICVHSLIGDLDELGTQHSALSFTVKHMSPATLAGARLRRLSKSLESNKLLLDGIVMLRTDGSLTNLIKNVDAAKESALLVATRAHEFNETAEYSDLRAIQSELDELSTDLRSRIEVSHWPIKNLRRLASAFRIRSGKLNIKGMEQEAEALLSKLRKETKAPSEVEKIENGIQKTLNRGKELKENITNHEKFLKGQRKAIEALKNMAHDYAAFLATGVYDIREAKRKSKQIEDRNANILRSNEILLNATKELRSVLNATIALTHSMKVEGNLSSTIDEIRSLMDSVRHARIRLKKSSHKEIRRRRELKEVDYNAHANHLENQARNLSRQFSNTKKEANRALKAANIYSDLLETLRSIHSLVAAAKSNSLGAKNAVDDQPKLAVTSKQISSNITASLPAIRNSLDKVSSWCTLKTNLTNLQHRLDEQKKMHEQYKTNPRNDTAIDSLRNTENELKEVENKLDNLKNSAAKMESDVSPLEEKVKEATEENKKFSSQIDNTMKSLARVTDATKEMNSYVESTNQTLKAGEKMKRFKGRLQDLKDQIARARDLVQRVQLTVKFAGNSNLELPLPHRIPRTTAYTKAECFINSGSPNGIIFFYGNEESTGGQSLSGDYIVLALRNGKPYLTLSLENKVTTIQLDKAINDNEWWKLTAEHVGEKLSITAKKAGTLEPAIGKTEPLIGRNRVFNIREDTGRLFVGGIPPNVKVHIENHSSQFAGEIDNLIINDEYVPLWNPTRGRSSNIVGSRIRSLGDVKSTNALTFDGDGYGIMYLPGGKKPQKNTAFSIQFQTYNPDGLLYYLGTENNSEFMLLGLSNGAVQLAFNLGLGEKTLSTSNRNYNDGRLHSVDVSRRGRRVRLTVGNEKPIEAESDGEDSELDVGDEYYIGGLPHSVSSIPIAVPFRGCIKDLKLNSHLVDLSKPKATKNVLPGCYVGVVRTASFPLDKSHSIFHNVNHGSKLDLMFLFKTKQQTGHLVTVQSSQKIVTLELKLENGVLIASVEGTGNRKLDSRTLSDGRWHFLSVRKDENKLRIEIDLGPGDEIDVIEESAQSPEKGLIQFGQQPDGGLTFQGCIADVILDGKLLNFREATNVDIQLTGCYMAEEVDALSTTTVQMTSTKAEAASTVPTTFERDMGACTLSKRPLGKTDDDRGQRFGLLPDSRLEYHKLPTSFDKKSVFTVQLRPTALHGLIMLSKDKRNVDYISLYLVNGSVNFAFNAGHGPVVLRSKRYLVDGKWHSIVTERFERNGTLYVDGNLEDNGLSPGRSVSINSEPPLYIGGLPKDPSLLSSIVRLLPGLKPTFYGCMRNFTLNGAKLDNPKEQGLAPCSEGTEKGTYFGEKGGYVVLHRNFTVEPTFTVELEVRPRTKTAVLLSVNGIDSFTIELLDGTVQFSVTHNGKRDTVSTTSPVSNALCDGHWHTIKAFKSKNVLMLTVDSKNKYHLLKDGSKLGMTLSAPLYLGGLPKGTTFQFLNTTEPYIGCIRYEMKDKTKRKKKHVEFSEKDAFGDVTLSSCPAN